MENCAVFQILRDKTELTLHVMSYFTKSGLLFKTLPIILPFLSKSLKSRELLLEKIMLLEVLGSTIIFWSQIVILVIDDMLTSCYLVYCILCLYITIHSKNCILQGIYARAIHGNASAEDASLFGNLVEPLACAGLKVALQAQ